MARPDAKPGSSRRQAWLVAGLIGLAVGTARAEPLSPERDFPLAGACYGRVYEPAHLAGHRGQIVAEIYAWGSSRSLVASRPLRDRIDPELDLTVRVVTTDGRLVQQTYGCPEVKGRIARCGAATCAGGFGIDRAGRRLRILNDNAEGAHPTASQREPGFGIGVACASKQGLFVPPDAENRTFLLARMPFSACIGEGSDRPRGR